MREFCPVAKAGVAFEVRNGFITIGNFANGPEPPGLADGRFQEQAVLEGIVGDENKKIIDCNCIHGARTFQRSAPEAAWIIVIQNHA